MRTIGLRIVLESPPAARDSQFAGFPSPAGTPKTLCGQQQPHPDRSRFFRFPADTHVTENLIPLEHTAAEIHAAVSGDEQIEMLSENIMIYVKEFGNLNKSNVLIDNAYIGMFIEELRREFNF